MTRDRVATLVVIASVLLTGCRTQLGVAKVGTEAPAGHVYFLPRVEHVVTLDRELIKCDVSPSIDLLAHRWLQSEAKALSSLAEALRLSALQRIDPKCPGSLDRLNSTLGQASQRVVELLPQNLPPCNAPVSPDVVSTFKSAYENVLREILLDFLRDPILVGGVDWGSQCPAGIRNPESLNPSINPANRVKEIAECPAGFNQAAETVDIDLAILMRASAISHALPDLNHAYAIDYPKMTDGSKKTEYTVEKYPNGTLKSVNAVIDDRTAEVIQGTLRGALKLAAASGGIPFAPAAAGAQAIGPLRLPLKFDQWRKLNEEKFAKAPLCKGPIRQLLRQRADLEAQAEQAADRNLALLKQVEEATMASGSRTKEAADFQKELDALPATDPGRKALEDKIEKLKAEAKAQATKAEQLTKERTALEKAQGGSIEKFAKLREQLTFSTTHLFRVDKSNEERIEGGKEAAIAWFDADALKEYCDMSGLPCQEKIPAVLSASVASYLASPTSPFAIVSKGNGLVYREPARGLLVVCKESACLDAKGSLIVPPRNNVLTMLADFPQAGVLAELPLVNKTFQNNSLVASFSALGVLEKLEYKSNARAEKAAETFEGAAGDVLGFVEAKQGAKKKKLETQKAEVDAEKALLESKLAREKARKDLEDLLNPEPPEE